MLDWRSEGKSSGLRERAFWYSECWRSTNARGSLRVVANCCSSFGQILLEAGFAGVIRLVVQSLRSWKFLKDGYVFKDQGKQEVGGLMVEISFGQAWDCFWEFV